MNQSEGAALPGLPLNPKTVHAHWVLFLIEGILLTLVGGAAIVVPAIASLASTIFFGWLLILAGLIGLFGTVTTRSAPGFVWSLLSALVALIAGAVLILFPVAGMVSLTIVLTAFLAADGLVMVVYALAHRQEGTSRWVGLLLNGLLDLVLVALILMWFPLMAGWLIGIILGIDFVFGGVSLIAMALAARNFTA